MNKSQRIYINDKNQDIDKHIKVKLEQNVKSLEYLSMTIDTNDVYQNFNSDYGVLVGRVLANNSIGVPNAKISIFIPLTDADSTDSDIYSLYPYKTPREVNNDGKRYNLLPRVGKYSEGTYKPPQPFGSFPIKEEIVTNDKLLNIYKKYYKYTATTNDAGDYMIFGVPTGTQTVHLSVDITDIGKYSMTPASMIKSLGYSENLFIKQTIIKPSKDLDDLPNIETHEVTVDILPFWGDTSTFEIGITRQDFKIRSVIRNTFTIFGSVFTDGDGAMWGDDHDSAGMFDFEITDGKNIRELYRAIEDANNTISISTKRTGTITEKIYCYNTDVKDNDINNPDPDIADPVKNMILLQKSEYSIYQKEGNFVIIVNCNRNKVITDDFGNEKQVSNDYAGGVFTEFKGFLTIEITPEDLPMNFISKFGHKSEIVPYRYILKFPQQNNRSETFVMPYIDSYGKPHDQTTTKIWRKQHFTFKAGNYYSLARFHGTTYNSTNRKTSTNNNGFLNGSEINVPYNKDPYWNVGIIATGPITTEITNIEKEFPSNSKTNSNIDVFGANWLNLSVYLPQSGYVTKEFSKIEYIRTADNFSPQLKFMKTFNAYYNEDNTQDIAAGETNTKWFARSDLNWTDIIEIPKTDIQLIKNIDKKGFKTSDPELSGITLTINNYKNGSRSTCPINGGKINGDPTNSTPDPETYFYKGIGNINCIDYLFELGLII